MRLQPWINPATVGVVHVYCSDGNNQPYGRPEDILSRDANAANCHTSDDKLVHSLLSRSFICTYKIINCNAECCSLSILSITLNIALRCIIERQLWNWWYVFAGTLTSRLIWVCLSCHVPTLCDTRAATAGRRSETGCCRFA